MRCRSLSLAVAFAHLAAATALAETTPPASDAPRANVPTVTIINKAPADEALPELREAPPAPKAPETAKPEVVAPATPTNVPADAAAATAPADAATPTAAAPGTADATEEVTLPPPEPTLAIDIDLTRQVLTVSEDGVVQHTWKISSARYGYSTPTGTFRPTWMAKQWYSRQYDYAPMPHAIFFHKGVAIHATYATGMLGRPASHGCVRLAPRNAATLFKMVGRHGKDRTEIVVRGRPDHSGARIAETRGTRQLRRGSGAYAAVPRGYTSYGQAGAYYYTPRRQQRVQVRQPRYQPRGLFTSSSSGYGF